MALVNEPSQLPVVTIIVPTHNGSPWLPGLVAAFDSLQSAIPSLQVVIVDDASTDDTQDYLSLSSSTRAWMKTKRNTTRLGPGVCRNMGLSSASGRYVVFADVDDVVYWDQLATLLGMDDAQNDITAFRFSVIQNGAEVTQDQRRGQSGRLMDFGDSLISQAAVWRFVFRREFLELVDVRFPPLSYGEDIVFLLELASHRPRFVYRDQVCYGYRTGHKRRVGASRKEMLAAVRALATLLPELSSRKDQAIAGSWMLRIAILSMLNEVDSRSGERIRALKFVSRQLGFWRLVESVMILLRIHLSRLRRNRASPRWQTTLTVTT